MQQIARQMDRAIERGNGRLLSTPGCWKGFVAIPSVKTETFSWVASGRHLKLRTERMWTSLSFTRPFRVEREVAVQETLAAAHTENGSMLEWSSSCGVDRHKHLSGSIVNLYSLVRLRVSSVTKSFKLSWKISEAHKKTETIKAKRLITE